MGLKEADDKGGVDRVFFKPDPPFKNTLYGNRQEEFSRTITMLQPTKNLPRSRLTARFNQQKICHVALRLPAPARSAPARGRYDAKPLKTLYFRR
jgi:hypothetical protein